MDKRSARLTDDQRECRHAEQLVVRSHDVEVHVGTTQTDRVDAEQAVPLRRQLPTAQVDTRVVGVLVGTSVEVGVGVGVRVGIGVGVGASVRSASKGRASYPKLSLA